MSAASQGSGPAFPAAAPARGPAAARARRDGSPDDGPRAAPLAPSRFRLGPWEIDPLSNEATDGSAVKHLRPRVVDLLVFLVERRGRVVTRSEILDAVWETRIVSDSVLSQAVAEAREVLGDDPEHPWLIETIQKRGYRVRPLPPAPPAAPRPVSKEPPAPWSEDGPGWFVGRTAEMERLEASLETARSGRGQVVFVVGEMGSGKTACMAELARRALARADGTAVAGGRCPLGVGPTEAYLPFVEALRVLSGDPGRGWPPGATPPDPARAIEWSRTLSEAAAGCGLDLGGLLHPVGGVGGWASGVVTGELAATLRAFSQRRPLVLLLDDLQWVDRGSLAVLFGLGRQLAGSRILLVASFREEELWSAGGRHPLERTADELAVGGDAAWFLRLGDAPERGFVDALVDAVPNRLDATFREALFALTEGHPLFTVGLLRSLRERAVLSADGDGRWVLHGPADWPTLPPRVQAVIRERVGGLPPLAGRVLAAASAVGDEFDAEAVAAALEEPVARIVEVLAGPLGRQRRLVCPTGLAGAEGRSVFRYRFRHVLFRRTLADHLDEAETALWLGRIAAASA